MSQSETGKQNIYGADGENVELKSQDDAEKALLEIMKGIKFPRDRASLINHAKDRKAGLTIIKWLENLPEKKSYQTLEEFRQAFLKDYNNYGAVREPEVTPGPEDQ